MAAPKGNQFWRLVQCPGRKVDFASPQELWSKCVEYLDWCQANPLEEEKVFHARGMITRATVSKMRAMTQQGLCLVLGITRETWNQYGKKEGFSDIVATVNKIIYEQKFTGAAADLLNPNIIARELGLSEKSEHTGEVGLRITRKVIEGSSE